jgi:GxxExxY protein
MTKDELTHQVIGIAMKVHRALGPGFLESVYHRSLEIEWAGVNLSFQSEVPVNVFYQQTLVGKFQADLIISQSGGGRLLIELKAVETIVKAHEAQTANYLTATGIDDALILNFGTSSLQFKHKYRKGLTLAHSDPA